MDRVNFNIIKYVVALLLTSAGIIVVLTAMS